MQAVRQVAIAMPDNPDHEVRFHHNTAKSSQGVGVNRHRLTHSTAPKGFLNRVAPLHPMLVKCNM
ncbi:hypothetical protein E2C01_001416 [Portunus trituberculatus]|uniref:Uncharacterized protein n=1 Tax=Portunus trituberculatus TaxID=210409 RepID=A0A5B7CMH3_PORTR|nr:hypothetical protein [Portunus trituberculatus]